MPVATQRGGAEVTLLQALRHGDDATWLVAFLEDGPMVATAASLGAQTAVIDAGRIREAARFVGTVRRLRAVFRRWNPQVAVSWMPKAHVYTVPAAAGLGIPTLWFQHGLPLARDPLDRAIALLPAAGVFAPSRTVAEAQSRIWPRRRAHVAYPGVELEELPPASASRPLSEGLGIPADAPIVGLVARFQRWKGIHVLLEALPRVLRSAPEARVIVVGGDHALEPGYRDELARRAAELGVADRFHMTGYQADAPAWTREFDVVVHASDREPFGIVVIEAMALGKPLVAGAAGGPAEILRDGVEGFLVEFGDSDALADRILRYLDDPELARRMGEAAARRAQDFSAERFAKTVTSTLRASVQGA